MRVISIQSIAGLFGVTPATIHSWQGDGFPVEVRGAPGIPSEFDSARCIRWLVDRELRKVQSETPSDRLARVKADAIEMDNAERRGKLIPADLLEPKLKAAFVSAREKWLDAVPRLARELPNDAEAREEMLQAEFEAFLTRLSHWSNADELEADEEQHPPTPTKGVPHEH